MIIQSTSSYHRKYLQEISYKLSDENILFQNTDIERHYEQIVYINSLKLESEDGAAIKQILKSSLIHLREDNESKIYNNLKLALDILIDKISKIENIDSKILNKTKKIYSLIHTKKEIELPSITPPSKPINVFNSFKCREIGFRIPSFKKFENDRIINNMKINNFVETRLEEEGIDMHNIIKMDVQYPLAVTLSCDLVIKLWNLETKRCEWTYVVEPRGLGTGQLKIVNNHVVFKVQGLYGQIETAFEDIYEDITDDKCDKIIIIDIQSGELKAAVNTENEALFLESGIFCILDNNDIQEWNFDGKLIDLIEFEKLSSEDIPILLGSKNFLVIIDNNNVIQIYDRQKKCNKKIILGDAKVSDILSTHIDDNRLICGFRPYIDTTNVLDCCVIDLAKGHIINQFKIQSESTNYGVTKIAADKKRIYLGYDSGSIVVINLAEKKYEFLGEHSGFICNLVLNGQILMSLSRKSWDHEVELKTWDLESGEKLITEMSFSLFSEISFNSKKIYISEKKTIIERDFLTAEKDSESKIEDISHSFTKKLNMLQ